MATSPGAGWLLWPFLLLWWRMNLTRRCWKRIFFFNYFFLLPGEMLCSPGAHAFGYGLLLGTHPHVHLATFCLFSRSVRERGSFYILETTS